MNKLTDPGKEKSRAGAKMERLKAWRRPNAKAARDKARDERLADWRERYGDPDSTGIRPASRNSSHS